MALVPSVSKFFRATDQRRLHYAPIPHLTHAERGREERGEQVSESTKVVTVGPELVWKIIEMVLDPLDTRIAGSERFCLLRIQDCRFVSNLFLQPEQESVGLLLQSDDSFEFSQFHYASSMNCALDPGEGE